MEAVNEKCGNLLLQVMLPVLIILCLPTTLPSVLHSVPLPTVDPRSIISNNVRQMRYGQVHWFSFFLSLDMAHTR